MNSSSFTLSEKRKVIQTLVLLGEFYFAENISIGLKTKFSYCYGGGCCVRLGGRSDLLKSIVIAHPGGYNINDVQKFAMPSLWLCAEGWSHVLIQVLVLFIAV